MRKRDIKTIDIHGKEWFDKVNGNSYCSARTVINFGKENAITLYTPFQYGYGEYYKQAAMSTLRHVFPKLGIDDHTQMWQFCADNKIVFRYHIETDCRKRDVIQFGITDI